MRPQIQICGHSFKSVGADCNLWPQFEICGNRLKFVATDSNMWPQICICGHRFQSVSTDSNSFPQIQICGHRLQSVSTDSSLWEQIAICGHSFKLIYMFCDFGLLPYKNTIVTHPTMALCIYVTICIHTNNEKLTGICWLRSHHHI